MLATGYHPRHSPAGIIWTAITAAAMFALAAAKARTGRALSNPVLRTEGRVTLIDGILATTVLAGLALNAAAGQAARHQASIPPRRGPDNANPARQPGIRACPKAAKDASIRMKMLNP